MECGLDGKTRIVEKFKLTPTCRGIGKHHEIYLSDIRRAAPEKWKTIIRQPMS